MQGEIEATPADIETNIGKLKNQIAFLSRGGTPT